MTYSRSITSKGQVTIPKDLRDLLHLKKGEKAIFSVNNKGEIVLGRTKTIQEIRAILGKPGKGEKLSEREKIIIPQLLKKYDSSAN